MSENIKSDLKVENVQDGSDAALSSSSEYDCCKFGKDYEPMPMVVMQHKKWPIEWAADDYLETHDEEPHNRD